MELLRPALAVRERVYGPDHPRVANTLNELGSVALRQGDLATAEAMFSRMAEIYRRAYDDRHYLIGVALSNLASVYAVAGDHHRAEHTLRLTIERFSETLSADHVNTAIARIKLGQALSEQGRYRDAEADLLAGYTVLAGQVNPSGAWMRRAREHLATVYDALDAPELAARYRAELGARGEAARE